MSSKATWVSSICQIYIGSVFNALRDRYKDYTNALYKMIPREESQNNQVVQQQQQVINQNKGNTSEM
jgi:hypothetical protein